MEKPVMIKVSATGEHLPLDATQWDAVLLPQLGLMFSATDVGDDEVDFAQAEAACANLTLAGFTDWRLPERQELEAILDLSRHSPAIDPTYFRDTKCDWYWTGTPTAWSSARAWFVGFDNGNVHYAHRPHPAFVRAVRVARALCKHTADTCNTDAEDEWTIYSDDFKQMAAVAITALRNAGVKP